jgi:hypothetical protein
MPDEEEARLLGETTKYYELSLAAWAALAHSVHSVVDDGETDLKLLEANTTARLRYVAARAALWAYRTSHAGKKLNGS